MFCDETKIHVQAGKGGDGLISFHREKYIAKGGPNGGDGGRGGDVLIRADENEDSLIELHTKKKFRAKNGETGGPQEKHGASSEDLVLLVPVGTQIFDDRSGELIADLKNHQDELVAAVGGRGGFGNAHFCSSIRQTPRFAELGEPGTDRDIRLELKMVADVGIIGLPSAGKSTFISAVSAARPKIGDFPFTTIIPNLGVAKLQGKRSLIICDMPGLIEGASQGKGLGDQFLRHVSRNRVLIHLLDISSQTLAEDYLVIRKELEAYDSNLMKKPELIVLSKIDVLEKDPELLQMITDEFAQKIDKKPKDVFHISSASHEGLTEVLDHAHKIVVAEKEREKAESPLPSAERVVFRPHLTKNPKAFEITEEGEGFRVSGVRLEQIVVQTDFTNPEGVLRVRDVLRKMGIESKLISAGAKRGTPIFIGKQTLELQPNIISRKSGKFGA